MTVVAKTAQHQEAARGVLSVEEGKYSDVILLAIVEELIVDMRNVAI